jgi:predicted ferric reductase
MDDVRRTIPAGAWRLILGIMAAIVVWGLFHAIGAWRLNNDVRRLFVVLGCVAAFLGFWGALLVTWGRKSGTGADFGKTNETSARHLTAKSAPVPDFPDERG